MNDTRRGRDYRAAMRPIFALLTALWLTAAAPPPPEALAPYVHDGRFDPGDYDWLRGRFDEAAPADKARYAAVRAWLARCREEGEARVRTELQAMGVYEPKLEQSGLGDPLCDAVASVPREIPSSFGEFQRAAAEARPVAETWLYAVRNATEIGGPRGPGLADKLLARPLGEQMLRRAMSWGEGEMKDAPALSPAAKAIFLSRMSAAAAVADHANTEWLKAVVDREGWPTISRVGAPASQQAWLLVQHADADPAFQLKVLRLMEPLTRTAEVSKRNYAYLYDRVMLKVAGKQRYATQMTCRNGQRVPQPLEDEAGLARERKAMELDPIEQYLAQMHQVFGDCPPEPSRHAARP
jgi:hypothetical protein